MQKYQHQYIIFDDQDPLNTISWSGMLHNTVNLYRWWLLRLLRQLNCSLEIICLSTWSIHHFLLSSCLGIHMPVYVG